MEQTRSPGIRKRLMSEHVSTAPESAGEIDIASRTSFAYTSEDPHYPLEHLIDGRYGRGGTRWMSASRNSTEQILLEFEFPQRIRCLVYEVEEDHEERTQEVRVEASEDHGRTYRQVLVQDYTFSPHGATFQHEEILLNLPAITHLRLTIVPNKNGSGTASLTGLRLFTGSV